MGISMSRYATDIARPDVHFRGFESRPGDYVIEADGGITVRRGDGSPLLHVPASPSVLAQLEQLTQIVEVERRVGAHLDSITTIPTPNPERTNRLERRAAAARKRRQGRPWKPATR
jgi:hypothetical protein